MCQEVAFVTIGQAGMWLATHSYPKQNSVMIGYGNIQIYLNVWKTWLGKVLAPVKCSLNINCSNVSRSGRQTGPLYMVGAIIVQVYKTHWSLFAWNLHFDWRHLRMDNTAYFLLGGAQRSWRMGTLDIWPIVEDRIKLMVVEWARGCPTVRL